MAKNPKGSTQSRLRVPENVPRLLPGHGDIGYNSSKGSAPVYDPHQGAHGSALTSASQDGPWPRHEPGDGQCIALLSTSAGQDRGDEDGGLVHALMPMIWMLRLFLMLPVSITTSGRSQHTFRFRWRSSIMVATFGTWTLLVVVAYYAVRYRIDPLIDTTKHFHLWDTVPKYASAVNFCYIFFMPFTCWTTADRAVAFVEYWSIFEAEMRAALQARVSLARVTRRAWCWCAAGVGLPLLLVILSLFTLPGEVLWLSPVLLHSFVFMTLGNAFWLLCCSTFARVADYQAGRLRSDLRRLGMRGLRAHRSIWQGMARTLDMMSASWGRTQMLLLAISFVNLTSIAFLFTHFIVDNVWESPVSWLATLMLLSAISIIAICNSAHVATSGLRGPFIKELLLISLSAKGKSINAEICRFLDDIRLKSPEVSLGGLTVLSRSSILSAFALATTYLVVLSQFTISTENTAVNFSEIPPDPFLDSDF